MQCCPRRWYSWDNIAQVKSLCSAGFGALDNITHKQILFNVFLIILGQHCTGQKPCNVVQRHHATMHRKNLVPCCLNTLGSWGNISEVKSLCNVAWEATALHKKTLAQCCLNTLGPTLHRKYLMQYCTRGSRQHKGKNPDNSAWTTSGPSGILPRNY